MNRRGGSFHGGARRVMVVGLLVVSSGLAHAGQRKPPAVEEAVLTFAPDVPPPITRNKPATVRVRLDAGMKTMPFSGEQQHAFWTFNDRVPGPFLRARVGDTLVDHAIFRVEKGAVGYLQVEGDPRHDLYVSPDDAVPCAGCLVHP